MKKIQSILLILAFIAVGSQSCQKDVSLEPIAFEPTTFTTEALLLNQLAGVYNVMQTGQLYGEGLWGYLTAGTDESFRSNATATTILTQLYNINSAEANVFQFWKQLYIGIERANVLLDVVDKPQMDEAKRKNIRGQAKFLRAYYFYLLVTHFGDVPLKTQLSTDMGTDFNLSRTPTKEIYAFILKEMTEAEPLVVAINAPQDFQASGPTTTVVSRTAVQAVLARVCLSMAGEPLKDETKYKDALDWAQKVVNSNLHSLNATPLAQAAGTPAYARLFINNMQNNANDNAITEGIWDAAFLSKSNATGTYANTGYGVNQVLGAIMGVYCPDATPKSIIGFSGGVYRVYPKLYNSYKAGDMRRDWIAAPYLYKDATTNKYFSLTVTITGAGTGAAATAFTNAKGEITRIDIDNAGTGYTVAPTISFSSYGTNTTTTQQVTNVANIATATATVANGQITAITVVKAGAGYPTVYDRCVGKWRREYETNVPPTRLQNNTSSNFPIIRYADVLLMAAEADLKVNGTPSVNAVNYYNQVRRRAYGLDPKAAAATLDVATFTLQDIIDERARELCFEGQRFNDLKRWGIVQKTMQDLLTDVTTTLPTTSTTYNVSATIGAQNFLAKFPTVLLLPIPANEIALANKLTQNPGW
jgi:starch-binding outer membrane protein, SusD/RagB family